MDNILPNGTTGRKRADINEAPREGRPMADKQFSFTLFPDQFAKSFEPIQATLEEMAHNIELPCAASKAELPWLKMAIMGDKPSEKGCYRTNENVAALTGIEADYDSGAMSFDEAALWLDAARLTALLYTP